MLLRGCGLTAKAQREDAKGAEFFLTFLTLLRGLSVTDDVC